MAMRRRLLNTIEIVADSARAADVALVDKAFLDTALSENLRRFDKGGDAFYDQISALHKSVRGSDPDAALYWLCRMLDGGADPRYLARRIVRMASEDIGLADPRALRLALDAAEVYERLGSPEGELTLAQAVIYLACAAKSNASYVAYNEARAYVREHGSAPVPVHLRNAPTKLMKSLGHGHAYRYAHDEPNAYAAGESSISPTAWSRVLPAGRSRAGRPRSAKSWRGCVHWTTTGLARGCARRPRPPHCYARALRAAAGRTRYHAAALSFFAINGAAMIDLTLLRKDLDAVVARLADRGFALDAQAFRDLEAARKSVQTRAEDLQARRNTLSKQIGAMKGRGEDTSEVMAQVAGLAESLTAVHAEQRCDPGAPERLAG